MSKSSDIPQPTLPASTYKSLPIKCYALLIGINEYTNINFPDLSGAVNDAKMFERFLNKAFAKPVINSLHNREASREGIIDAIKSLSHKQISKGDSVIIFFAGHGGRTNYENHSCECLIPSDANRNSTSWIHDYEMAKLLNYLSKTRGNNITLILDCCYSGGVNRKPDIIRSRSIGLATGQMESVITEKQISVALKKRVIKPASEWIGLGHDSHMLLAACQEDESAWEHAANGYFSETLIEVLAHADLANLDYDTLIRHEKLATISAKTVHQQRPLCDGKNRYNAVFQRHVPRANLHLIRVKAVDSKPILLAGSVHGIREGDRFTLYDKSFGLIREGAASEVREEDAILVATFSDTPTDNVKESNATDDLLQTSYAELVQPNHKISICVVPRSQQTPFPRHILSHPSVVDLVEETTTREKADLIVTSDNDSLSYEIRGVPGSAAPHIPLDCRTLIENHGDFREVLRRAARFWCFLSRNRPQAAGSAHTKVKFLELKSKSGRIGPTLNLEKMEMEVVSSDLLNANGEVTVRIKKGEVKYYGITLSNKARHLYPYAFLFSGSDLSIDLWDINPITAGDAKPKDAPLQPGSSLDIGHGKSAAEPLALTLETGHDTTWLKLYLTTKPSDFSFLAQDALVPETKRPFNTLSRHAKSMKLRTTEETWETVIVPLIHMSETSDV